MDRLNAAGCGDSSERHAASAASQLRSVLSLRVTPHNHATTAIDLAMQVLTHNKLVVANLGDSRCVLGEWGDLDGCGCQRLILTQMEGGLSGGCAGVVTTTRPQACQSDYQGGRTGHMKLSAAELNRCRLASLPFPLLHCVSFPPPETGKVGVRGGVSAVALSVDHTPMDPREAGRVVAAGVSSRSRVVVLSNIVVRPHIAC